MRRGCLVSCFVQNMRHRRGVTRSLLTTIAATVVAMAWTGEVRAAPVDVYTVANFQLEASDDDAVKAKKRAIAEGQQRAFRLLLKRLVHYRDFARLPDMDARAIERFIDRFSVRREKNSRTQYLATFDFRFQANAIQSLLRNNGIPFVDQQAPQFVVVPVFLSGDKRDQKAWYKKWKALDLAHSLTPIKLAKMSSGLTVEKLTTVLSGDPDAFDDMSRQYSTRRLVFVVAEPTGESERLTVRLIGRDAVDDINLNRNYSGFEPSFSAMEEAASVSLGIFEGRWKAMRLQGGEIIPESESETVLATVEFSGFREWKAIRVRLGKVPGLHSIDVGSISARGAEITLTYPGGAAYLSRQLAPYNLALENIGGAWILRSF